mmetsp:Transcript_8688/g.36212  ORF Transcript_8688/g.36212 Transcript_8688/m.36212 type:complete len:215 (+) Transcript_8688:34-678(+)
MRRSAFCAAILCVACASLTVGQSPPPPILSAQYSVAFMEEIFSDEPVFLAGFIYYDYDNLVTRTDLVRAGSMSNLLVNYGNGTSITSTQTNGATACSATSIGGTMMPPNYLQTFDYAGEATVMGQNCYLWSGKEGPLHVTIYTDVESGFLVAEQDTVYIAGVANTDMFFYQGYTESLPAGFDITATPCTTSSAANMPDADAVDVRLPGIFRIRH